MFLQAGGSAGAATAAILGREVEDDPTLVGNDQVGLSGGSMAFADRHAGTAKAVTVTGATLTGADAANYVLDAIAAGTATITPRALTLQAVSDSRIYDGTTASGGTVLASGLLAGDTVRATQQFESRHAGTRQLQVADGWVIGDGNGGGDYLVTKGAAVAGTIDRRIVSAAVTVQDKVYDGTALATGTIGGLTNMIAGDDVTLDASGGAMRFVDRNAGIGKAVQLNGLALGGSDAADYILSDLGSGSATIAKAALSLTASDDRKTYDGTRASTGTVTISGLIAGDAATATQAFDTKAAGQRTISADNWTIADGNDGGNYRIVKVDAAGTIDRKLLSGALTGTVSKVYDGTDMATVAPINLAGFVAGDAVTLVTEGARYADRNAGTGKRVTVTGMTLTGDDAANYLLGSDQATADIGTITARRVAVGVSGHGAKTYDGTMALRRDQLGGLTFVAAGDDNATRALLAADGVTLDLANVTGTLADRNAGTGKSVTLGGYALNGNTLGNYVLASDTVLGIADVTRAVLELAATDDAKTYDGTMASDRAVRIMGLIGGDMAAATQAFDDRNAGERWLKVNGYTLSDGNDGGNYAVRLVDAAGSIARRTLAVTIADATKTAGQADPVFGYALTGGTLVGGDQIGGAPTRDAGEQAGSYAIRAGTLSVSDNYALTVASGRLTITAAAAGGADGGNTGGGSTGGGNTGGGNTGGSTGGTITPVVVQQAQVLAERVSLSLPGTTETRNLPHQSTGSFESYLGFGWLGKEQLPGNRTVSMRLAINDQPTLVAEPQQLSTGADRPASDDRRDLCLSGRGSGTCGPVAGQGLPYPSNSAITQTIRFNSY